MKKIKFLSIVNWLLVFSIPAVIATTDLKSKTTTTDCEIKNLNTSLFTKIEEKIEKNKSKEEKEINDIEEEDTEEVKQKIKIVQDDKKETSKETMVEDKKTIVEEKQEPTIKEKEEEKQPVQTTQTYTGKVSYYKYNCRGCGGYTATGLDISDGRLYYNDPTYGNVRIVAAGKEIPLYSIVKISNISLGTINAIVLDRGGDIGTGKKFIIDILTNSSEDKGGVDSGAKVEVLRKGK